MSDRPLPYVLVRHDVGDYLAWKRIFDEAEILRRDAGERTYQVLRDPAHPNHIVHFSAWTSLEDARRFFESPELERIRAEAGVESPEFTYLELLDEGSLGYLEY